LPPDKLLRNLEELMASKKPNRFGQLMEQFSGRVTQATGSSTAFTLALSVIVIWAITGPLFKFSDTWQLVINTGTTIITFLMVFLIQRAQNKDALAIHLKLNEIVAALEGASNRLIDVEDLTEDDIKTLHTYYQNLSLMAKKDSKLTQSHSIEEAEVRHRSKRKAKK
jgi:low affinity Fe/Cu permease